MANTKEIKNHIESVKETQKITNAMYLIASTKMRRAKAELEETRPYFDALRTEIKRIFRSAKDIENRYFYPADGSEAPDGTYGCLVITADKGLAGAYNMNVIKETLKLLDEHSDTRLFVVGEYGRHYFKQHNIPIEQSFIYTAQNPTINRARAISDIISDKFERGKLDKIFAVYTDMGNGMTMNATSTRLLPFHRTYFTEEKAKSEKPVTTDFEFWPSIDELLTVVMRSYTAGYIYGALVDSFCSEQNARMMAMNAANDNAESLLANLSDQYNRVRQAAITQEITEVSAGAKAQRNKKEVKATL